MDTNRIQASMLRRCAGVTLIEMMVALTVGLILLAGLVTLLSNVSTARTELDKAGRQIENGRYALDLLSDDIHHAGYYGQYYALPPAPTALPDPCATTTAGLAGSDALPIQGYSAPASVPGTCATYIPATDYVPGTDILVIRRARASTTADFYCNPNTQPNAPIAGLLAATFYIQANADGNGSTTGYPIIDLGANTGSFTLLKTDPSNSSNTCPADIRQYEVHVYFISPCHDTSCAASTDTTPTLKRLELAGSGSMTVVPLAEGIANIHFEYGVDYLPTYAPATSTTPHCENTDTGLIGDAAPDCFVKDPGGAPAGLASCAANTDLAPCAQKPAAADPTFWANVVAVRVFLLARNTQATTGYTDNKTYCLNTTCAAGDLLGPYNDGFKRHVFTALVRATNPSSRREHF